MTNDFNRIIVHPGKAHRDDFMAVCLALTQVEGYPVIERKDPSWDELNDIKCLVLDTGMQLEPALNNFDHHQLPATSSECALSLYAQHCDIDLRIFNWYKTFCIADANGPYAAAADLGISPEAFMKTLSPIESGILLAFQDLYNALWFKEMMLGIGQGLLDYSMKVANDLKALHAESSVFTDIHTIFMPRKEPVAIRALEEYIEYLKDNDCLSDYAVLVSPDERGPGFTLLRLNDDPRFDFSVLEGRQDVAFAHKNGFIAKTKSANVDWESLVHMSMVKE